MKLFSALSLAAAMTVSVAAPAFAECADGHAAGPQQTVMIDTTKTQTPAPTVGKP